MTNNTKKRLKGKPFVNSWSVVVERWAFSVGLDPKEAVFVEKVLNPMGCEWTDLGNMKARVYSFMTGKNLKRIKKDEQYRKGKKRPKKLEQLETGKTSKKKAKK